jgi:hypothetical protein
MNLPPASRMVPRFAIRLAFPCPVASFLWRFSPPEWVGRVIVAPAAAEEHERHQAAADQEGKERPQAERNPAVFVHDGFACVPHGSRPDNRQDQYADQNGQDDDLA